VKETVRCNSLSTSLAVVLIFWFKWLTGVFALLLSNVLTENCSIICAIHSLLFDRLAARPLILYQYTETPRVLK
jgi:hypothetical protein